MGRVGDGTGGTFQIPDFLPTRLGSKPDGFDPEQGGGGTAIPVSRAALYGNSGIKPVVSQIQPGLDGDVRLVDGSDKSTVPFRPSLHI